MQSQLTPTVVGIDVGSFTSKVAAVNHGTVDIITN
jgi:molecular chaperone DnaK (HSP70)